MRYFLQSPNPIKVKTRDGLASTNVRQPSLVDDFYYDKSISSVDGEEVVGIHNPLYMLFNQQRLDRIGPEAIRQWVDVLNQAQHPSLNEIRKKCSDDDLLSMIKSRHIQSPSELERYISDLNNRADRFNSEVARVRAEMELESQQQQILSPSNTE